MHVADTIDFPPALHLLNVFRGRNIRETCLEESAAWIHHQQRHYTRTRRKRRKKLNGEQPHPLCGIQGRWTVRVRGGSIQTRMPSTSLTDAERGKKKEKKLTPQALFNFDTSQSALLDHFRTPSPFSLSSQNREFENLITLPGSHARGASALGNAQSIPTISFEYHSCRNDLSSCLWTLFSYVSSFFFCWPRAKKGRSNYS